jgi:hypothetical protein
MRGYSPAKKRAQPSAASTLHEPYLANTDLLHKNQEGPDLGWRADGTVEIGMSIEPEAGSDT